MAELEKQVRRVMRRLNFGLFLQILAWCWVGSLSLALCWVLAEKIWRPVVEPWWITVLASLGLGSVVAAVVWSFKRTSAVYAALALDEAFGLKERVSTTLTLPAELRESPAGIALVCDATKRVQLLEVGEKFRFQIPRIAWLPLVPAMLVFLVASFVKFDRSPDSLAKAEPAKERAQIEQAAKVSAQRLEKHQEQAKEAGFGETEKLLAELTKKAKALEEAKDIDQKNALAKMSGVQDALKERREKLGSSEQLQRQLEKLKTAAEKGPADKFQEALKQGDFKKAIDELNKIAEQLKTGKLDEAQKKALERQLAQMKQQLQKMANVEERKKQLEEQLKKAGMPQEQIQKELAKLDAQAKDLQKLQQLANKIGQMQQAMAKGDLDKVLETLEMSKADLQQLVNDLQELEMLDQAMMDMAEMKNAMLCKNCGGGG